MDADSITRHRDGTELPLAALDFFIELKESLGLSDAILPVYLEEISSTLSGTCYKLTKPKLTSAELANGGFQAVETGMTEGHPASSPTTGGSASGIHEYLSYAPETASPVRLVWLAAHRSRAAFTAGVGIEYESFVRDELGEATVDRFHGVLRERGLDPADYLFIPVHPWRWWNKLTVTFAAEVARGHLVCLGEGDDEYLAQQSIAPSSAPRTPEKRYVKTALSVINMGFMRGLSAAYMEATPAINDWLAPAHRGRPGAQVDGPVDHPGAGGRRLPAPGVRAGHRPLLAVPQDAGGAVAGEPGAVPPGRRDPRHHGLPGPRRPRGRLVRGRADRAVGSRARRVAAALPARPTSSRCCTASTPTTWCTCRTART